MRRLAIPLLFIALCGSLMMQNACNHPQASSKPSIRLPDHIIPQLGTWFWRGEELIGDGYKIYLDQLAIHSSQTLLTLTFRFPKWEITDKLVHEQVRLANEYALQKGISIAVDLDVRLARRAFMEKYPDEMQEMLILEETRLEENGGSKIIIYSKDLTDHYTGRTEHYIPLEGKVRRVYSYVKSPDGIDQASLRDITGECIIEFCTEDSIGISIPGSTTAHACAMVSFTHLSPDVFAPNLISFQEELIRSYSDIPLAGVCKDEWGFPPCFYQTTSEFWYSDHRAKAYAERTGGRELLGDCLMMSIGVEGKERERQLAINHFMDMSFARNSELEDAFYHTTKKVFGPAAFVATHPTWYPYPGFREYKKNGLDWWASTRDWAQTDEVTPFGVRTALAKKWGSPVWYNMYYADNIPDYERSVWSHALGGGRINYHPIYPGGLAPERELVLLRGDLMRAESRIRLLNYISESPLDCPVAVIFGHACTMNWAGPAYDDVGMAIVDSLWREGIPADLIPSTEIEHLEIDSEGWIQYGKQRYAAVVLYHPEFENKAVADFFNRAPRGRTRLIRTGDWTMDFGCNAFDGNAALPTTMIHLGDATSILSEIRGTINKLGISLQTPATDLMQKFGYVSNIPSTTGFCRLIDGTLIQLAGSDEVSGDPIRSEMEIGNQKVIFDAMGVAAVRLDDEGRVVSLAAGGLKSFRTEDMEIHLDERVDLAFWKDDKGQWEGVLQGWEEDVPPRLLELTDNWARLALPIPYTGPKPE